MSLDIAIRPIRAGDSSELSELLNTIISVGGMTALEEPFSPGRLQETLLLGQEVLCCFVAEDISTGVLFGFQSLLKMADAQMGDIATFSRVGSVKRGIGSLLFAATRSAAASRGLTTINATIRADNVGGLTFYTRMGFKDTGEADSITLKSGETVQRIRKHFALASDIRA